jgi:ribosomal protein L14E/L6E/L27E
MAHNLAIVRAAGNVAVIVEIIEEKHAVAVVCKEGRRSSIERGEAPVPTTGVPWEDVFSFNEEVANRIRAGEVCSWDRLALYRHERN